MVGTGPVHWDSLPACAAACIMAQAVLHSRFWSAQMHKLQPSAHARQSDKTLAPALPSSERETGRARLTSLSPLLGEVSADIDDPGHQRGLWHCQLLQHVEVVCGSLVHGAARWQKSAAGGCLGKRVGPTEDLQGSSRNGGRKWSTVPVCRASGRPTYTRWWARHQQHMH